MSVGDLGQNISEISFRNWAKNQYGVDAFTDRLIVLQDARALEMASDEE